MHLVKIDLKDAYLTVPVHKELQAYLKFKWKNNRSSLSDCPQPPTYS